MTNNEHNALVLIQQVFFDLTDLLNGENYQSLGYANKKEFLTDQCDRLAEAERRLFPDQSEVS